MRTNNYNLTPEEQKRANEERTKWEKKAIYWHSAIPPFDFDTRDSLTKDAQIAFNFEQLQLNKKLALLKT